jgi:cytidylate kinase
MQSCTLTVAIDGPAASGKSVVGREVARRLGIRFLDTGMMYRAVTWASIQKGIDPYRARELTCLAARSEIRLLTVCEEDRLLLGGDDITDRLMLSEVDLAVSAVSAISGVRRALVAQQRAIASDGPIVMCGRDIGTVVLPNACVKVFLTATVEVRARRRAVEKAEGADHEKIMEELALRDRIDSEREEAPMRPAEDAITIYTDNMTIEEVVQAILSEAQSC